MVEKKGGEIEGMVKLVSRLWVKGEKIKEGVEKLGRGGVREGWKVVELMRGGEIRIENMGGYMGGLEGGVEKMEGGKEEVIEGGEMGMK